MKSGPVHFKKLIYLFERESMSGGGQGEREREREKNSGRRPAEGEA